METAGFSETLKSAYQTTHRHNAEDSNLHIHSFVNIR
jgi:hypothetical protein